jgi:hypothetical protein
MCMWLFGSVRTFFEKFSCSWTWSFFQHVLNRRHLLCVINSSHTFKLTFFKPYKVVMDTLKMCMWLFGSVRTFFEKYTCSWTWSFFQHVLNRRHLLCVINSSHTFKLTFFKPYKVVMDTLKMCMWLFGSVRTFFEKFTCSWTWSFFQHVLNRRQLLCVINSSHTFRLTFFKPCTVIMDTLKICMQLSGRLQTLFEKFTCSWT